MCYVPAFGEGYIYFFIPQRTQGTCILFSYWLSVYLTKGVKCVEVAVIVSEITYSITCVISADSDQLAT